MVDSVCPLERELETMSCRTAADPERDSRTRGEDDPGRAHSTEEHGEHCDDAVVAELVASEKEDFGRVEEFDPNRSEDDRGSELR